MGEAKRKIELFKEPEKLPNGDTVAFVFEKVDCCVEKVILEYAPFLPKHSVNGLLVPIDKMDDCINYLSDYVVAFRLGLMNNPKVIHFLNYLKTIKVKTLYYTDDFIFLLNDSMPLNIAKECDSIIVATEPLKNYLEDIGISKPVYTLRTHMDLNKFDAAPVAPISNNNIKILFSSSARVGLTYLYEIMEIMDNFPNKYQNVEFIISFSSVGYIRSKLNRFRNIKKRYFDWLPLQQFYSLAKAIDIIIAPASEQDVEYFVPKEFCKLFLDSKSEVKYLLAGASRKPVIASPTYPYINSIKHNETGFIANNADEFLNYIDFLIENPFIRDKIGAAARKDVEER